MNKILLLVLIGFFAATGFAQNWSAVGSGTNGRVHAMIEFNGDLIIGGEFSQAGGQVAYNVARWDGTQYHPMGEGFAGTVYDFAIYGDHLYASGWFFNDPGNTQVFEGIARWTGAGWSSLPDYDPVSWGGEIYDMLVFDNELYITNHSLIGSDGKTRVSKYNGAVWTDLPGFFEHNGGQGQIYTLGLYNDQIIAGGLFDVVDGTAIKSVTKFNGTGWESLNMQSGGLFEKVYKVLEYNGELYAGGIYFDPKYSTLAKMTGETWTYYQMDVDGNLWDIEDLFVFNEKLFVSGVFYYQNGNATNAACCIFNETGDDYSWLNLNFYNANSTQWIGFNMAEYDGALYVGGDFGYAGSQDDPKNNIARFDGEIPSAINKKFVAPEFLSIAPNPASNTIYFQGDFMQNKGNRIMIWDLTGKLVYSNEFHGSSVDVSTFTSGTYQVIVVGEGKTHSGRFVKN